VQEEPGEPEGQKYLEDINTDDVLGAVLRGHLYVEFELIRLIEAFFVEPSAIDLTRVSFPVKVDLAMAMGILPEEERPALMFLNRLRNKLAHNLEATVTEEEERALLNALTPEMRSGVKNRLDFDEGEEPGLRHVMAVLYYSLEILRQKVNEDKVFVREVHAEVMKRRSEENR
jgi:hypothetical protein